MNNNELFNNPIFENDKHEQLNEEQIAAICAEGNIVTSAGAGSGKTTVLAKRFAYLVTEKNYKVESILTLTFTKKATIQMHEKIYNTLQIISESTDSRITDKAKKAAKEACDNFFNAKIQTLDSYCNTIVKLACTRYGIRPDFTIDSNKATEIARQSALPFILNKRNCKAIQVLANTSKFSDIANSLLVDTIINFSSICEPLEFTKLFIKQQDEIIQIWNKTINKCSQIIKDCINIKNSGDDKITENFKLKFYPALEQSIPDIDGNLLSLSQNRIISYCKYIDSLSYKISLRGQRADRNIYVSYIKELQQTCTTLLTCANFILQKDILFETAELLEEFQNIVNQQKRIQGILTFSDISTLALKILKENPDIRQIEKNNYKAIMIDEFQDDNNLQKELLFCLAEKKDVQTKGVPSINQLENNKLFFVGDEKQSIYKFRGADVSVFRRLATELTETPSGKLICMNTNYRSDSALIKAFNCFFGGYEYNQDIDLTDNIGPQNPSVFFKQNEQDIPFYEASYSPVKIPIQKTNQDNFPKVFVNMYNTEIQNDISEEEKLSTEDIEAIWTAQKIKTLIEEKKYKPEEICILSSTTTKQFLYEKYLRIFGVPYTSEKLTTLFSDGPVNDTYSFLRLCIYPSDTESYAQILNSPFINCSTQETNVILAEYQNEPFIISDAIQISDELKSKLKQKRTEYEILKQKNKTGNLTSCITYLWYDLGYRFETLWNQTVLLYNSQYDILFELARQADENNLNLSDFVDLLLDYKNGDQKLEDIDIPLERPNAVEIMTVHKSKGLEFPVVFICNCSGKKKAMRNEGFISANKEWGITLNLPPHKELSFTSPSKNYFYSLTLEDEKNKEAAETKRLLYVAMTRAENELYIVGHYPGTFSLENKNGSKRSKSNFTDFMSPILTYYLDNFDDQAEMNVSKKESPFVFSEIPEITRSELKKERNNNNRPNTKKSKLQFINTISKLYDKAEYIVKPEIESIYKSPSQLENSINIDRSTLINKPTTSNINNELQNAFKKIDLLINNDENLNDSFKSTNFGTIAHAYLEAALSNQEVFLSKKDTSMLSATELKLVENTCKQITENFINSDIGKKAINAEWKKTEYRFRARFLSKENQKNYIYKGSIDLVFQNNQNVYVIDYKTTKDELPQEYYQQLGIYSKAIASIRNVPLENVHCVLCYLRTGNNIDITNEVLAL